MHSVYERKNVNYWKDEIATSQGDMQRLWRTLHGALGERTDGVTGDHTADDFATFFINKVDSVRAATASTPRYDVPSKNTPLLSEWSPVTEDEVVKLISSAPTKTCQLDPVPTWLVKDVRVRDLLSPFLTVLFNVSLSSGTFPTKFKQAVIRPLLKKVGLDASDTKNFRPVSNLPFLSKLLERVVQHRLQEFLDSNDMMPSTQSAYRQFDSTETAVYSNLLIAADSGQISCSVFTGPHSCIRHTQAALAPSRASVWSVWCHLDLVHVVHV